MNQNKQHWEKVFQTKTAEQVSWTETYPQTSVDCILRFGLKKYAPIIDVGGGDSLLVDALLELGFSNLSVLDISAKALERAKERLGPLANKVEWIESDVLDFNPTAKYSLWHDRASFHFLTQKKHIIKYGCIVNQSNAQHLVIGTFSTSGPEKCSGLPISQYDCNSLEHCFRDRYSQDECFEVNHQTPFDTSQAFVFSRFSKKLI